MVDNKETVIKAPDPLTYEVTTLSKSIFNFFSIIFTGKTDMNAIL